MSEIVTRALYGFIYCAIVVAGVAFHAYGLLALLVLIYVIGLNELKHMLNANSQKGLFVSASLVGIFALLAQLSFTYDAQEQFLPFLTILVLILFIQHLFTKGSEADYQPLLKVIFSTLYLILPCALAISIAYLDGHWQPHYLLGLFFIIWANDTAAYLAGSNFGKRKLLPRISPKKSVEGLIGGIIGALLIGYVLSLFWEELSATKWIIYAFIISVASNVGDLFQSSLKRAAGVKDSGQLIPGHGGILDRLDSFLFSVPIVYFYLRFFT